MEKNGGSCAGKWGFHVFASDSLSTRLKISAIANLSALFTAQSMCVAVACRRRLCLACRR